MTPGAPPARPFAADRSTRATRQPSRAVAAVVALLGGFAVMALELTAVRLLAPHFGDSVPVWTNVIGVMLVALAGGAWLGGRLAGGPRAPARLAALLAVAGVLVAAVPLVVPVLGAWLLPAELPLDQAMAGLVRGSLAATLLLFAAPVALVGCMTPMLVAWLAEGGVRVGAASGLVACCSTLGSLVGTFAATHLLVPGIGSRATIWVCAAVILGCAALLGGALWRAPAAALPLALALLPMPPLRAPGPGQELVAEVESRYQYLQLVREPIDGANTLILRINEGLDSFHSVAVEGSAFTAGRYYDYHAVAPLLAGDGQAPAPLRVLSLGAAAGTFARLFAAAHPGCTIDGVEIDPAVVELGDRFFPGQRAPGTTHAGDARVFVERAPERYDVVLVDTYERQIYIPAQVASRQFFTAVARCLRPGGVVSVNSGGRTFADPVVAALSRTMAAVFGEAWAFRVPNSRNFMLLARNGRSLDPHVLSGARTESPELREVLAETRFTGAWQRFAAGTGAVLDDDRPLLDTLQEHALEQQLGFAGATRIAGEDDPDAAATAATAALQERRDYDGALASIAAARTPTPRLRLLAGDARWLLHDLPGARDEYRDALVLAGGGPLQAFAEGKLAAAEDEIGRRRLLEGSAVARRNGWVGLAAAAVLAALFGLALRLSSRAR